MTKVKYTKINPSGNISLIVESHIERNEQSRVAALLMARDEQAEQVGFLERPDNARCSARLQMMGGEFCGNASLSAAALLLRRAVAPVGAPCELSLEVSGAPEPVGISGSVADDGAFVGTVSMPLPESISEFCFLDGFECRTLPLVRFPGIAHAIVKGSPLPDAERLARLWCAQVRTEALGLMFLDERASRLTPLVYVASTGTAVWEGSCASGTAAVAAYLAELDGEGAELTLSEPRGTVSASARCLHGVVTELKMRSRAEFMGEFTVEIP